MASMDSACCGDGHCRCQRLLGARAARQAEMEAHSSATTAAYSCSSNETASGNSRCTFRRQLSISSLKAVQLASALSQPTCSHRARAAGWPSAQAAGAATASGTVDPAAERCPRTKDGTDDMVELERLARAAQIICRLTRSCKPGAFERGEYAFRPTATAVRQTPRNPHGRDVLQCVRDLLVRRAAGCLPLTLDSKSLLVRLMDQKIHMRGR
jgi:hypothetical protein